MPELPEVETMVRDLSRHVIGATITGVEAEYTGAVIYPDYPELADRVAGQTITGIGRRGKYAIFHLESGDVLIVHRGMSGSLLLRAAGDPPDPYVRVLFRLADGRELRFKDPRKFGKIFVMDGSGEERPFPWDRMGPEPLEPDFTLTRFKERLRGRTALIKPLLLNQNVVAGLGNIYVDEALYRAGIHPQRRADTLKPAEIKRLHQAIVDVLGEAVGGRGTTFTSYVDVEGRPGGFQRRLRVFHRQGQPCDTCGTMIEKFVVGGRGTHICRHCQKLPLPRARERGPGGEGA